jgi:hypothetical protein
MTAGETVGAKIEGVVKNAGDLERIVLDIAGDSAILLASESVT